MQQALDAERALQAGTSFVPYALHHLGEVFAYITSSITNYESNRDRAANRLLCWLICATPATSNVPVLHYYPVRGRAEPIR